MVGFEVPRSQHGDSDDVVVSLETARAQAEKSNKSEALRWIRRAARAAKSSGNEERAASLASAAAELARLIQRGDGGAQHAPVQDYEQPLPSDFDADFDDKTSVDRPPVPTPVDPAESPDDAAEDPTEPRRRVGPMSPETTSARADPAFQQVQALRVAVDPLAPGSKILVVHLLEEGESAGPGRREAVLIATNPTERLLPKE